MPKKAMPMKKTGKGMGKKSARKGSQKDARK